MSSLLRQDLWPEDLLAPYATVMVTPAIVLREQAAILGKKTNNLVEAEVVQAKASLRGIWAYNFLIIAPTLDYEYKLFTCTYNLNLYPVSLDVGKEMKDEIDPEYGYLEGKILVQSEEEFIKQLKNIFRASITKKIIGTLLAMCQEGGNL